MEHRKNSKPSLFIQVNKKKKQMFNKVNEKKSRGHQSMDPEYVTGQNDSLILKLLLRRFYCLIFAPTRKS